MIPAFLKFLTTYELFDEYVPMNINPILHNGENPIPIPRMPRYRRVLLGDVPNPQLWVAYTHGPSRVPAVGFDTKLGISELNSTV